MPETHSLSTLAHPSRMKLEPYAAEIRLGGLNLGIDNIHYDVFLSSRFVESTRKYLLSLLRQAMNVSLLYGNERERGRKPTGPPEHSAFRKLLSELLQESLTQAKFHSAIEIDILQRLAVLKFLTEEVSQQFSAILVEGKDWIRSRGELFEHSEQAHVMRSKIAALQANRKNVIRQVGETLCHVWQEIEEVSLARTRRALFGDVFPETYRMLQNRLIFVEGGNDDQFLLEHYVLLGNFVNDPDRFEVFDTLLRDLVQECAVDSDESDELPKARKAHERLLEQGQLLRSELARIEEEIEAATARSSGKDDLFPSIFGRKASPSEAQNELEDLRSRRVVVEQQLEDLAPQIAAAKQRKDFLAEEYQNRLGDYLNEPGNVGRLFDGAPAPGEEESFQTRLLEEWAHRLEERDLIFHVLAGYEMRKIAAEYCPPVHLQQLKKALVNREEARRVEKIVEQFPARKISMRKLEDGSRAIRRRSHEETLRTVRGFAEDLMRLRRDRRDYQQAAAWMERINLVRDEHSRELSRSNRSLYELLLAAEHKPKEDPIVNHVVIKADVRGSTGITKDLLARGMNPASHFSMALHEPVKRMLESYDAAKVFIEGDAIILAIYETESTRATQRAVARACVLAREILAVTHAYNQRAQTTNLPPLELGVGVAFQDSPPSLWTDADSRIMISRALNLSDRLSSCSKLAKRLFVKNQAPFNVYHLQTLMDDTTGEEGEELLVRYNLNGIELNDEGFQKLASEISLAPLAGTFSLPWGKEKVQMYFGEVPLGESLKPIVIRKGFVHQLLAGGQIGTQGTRTYYEVCTNPQLIELACKKLGAASAPRA